MNPEPNTTWTAPQLVALQRVDQAEAGANSDIIENVFYYPSSAN